MTPAERKAKLEQLISAWGIANAADAVEAWSERGVPQLSDCLAMLENESGGRNVFGADPGGNALPRRWFDQPVTRFRYTIYKLRRNMGFTPNGVGPCQLTDVSEQKAAERAGGCWKPLHNMQVGFDLLHRLQLQLGRGEGFRQYNGSGPAADAYAQRALERAATWHDRFTKAGLA